MAVIKQSQNSSPTFRHHWYVVADGNGMPQWFTVATSPDKCEQLWEQVVGNFRSVEDKLGYSVEEICLKPR